jgi:hypothetical protein
MTHLRTLGAIALSSFIATAALAGQPRDVQTANSSVSHLSCSTNPSFAFCQVASADNASDAQVAHK